ncbi:MAG: D-glycerate dehydrogenase [Armatimonadota bacterium]|nr:MAG: D-glycerate dehydrogenase [Armatimonadota bacterium]
MPEATWLSTHSASFLVTFGATAAVGEIPSGWQPSQEALVAESCRIFVTRPIPEAARQRLCQACLNIEVNAEDRGLTRDELIRNLRDRDAVLTFLTDRIDAEIIEGGGELRVIANCAVGFDNIDVRAATARGIIVTNTPDVLTDATADLAWALLMAVVRRVVEADRLVRAGKFRGWEPGLLLGSDLVGKTLAVIGTGRVGSAFAMRSKGFNMRVVYVDERPNDALERELGARRVDLETALREADFVSLHVPLTPDTRHFIGAERLGMMKPTAYLVNTARGAVVDEAALVQALREKRIAGAALDVFENEPQLTDGLAELDNVVLAPHIGSATVETRTRMIMLAAENVFAAMRGEAPPNIVNREVVEDRNGR